MLGQTSPPAGNVSLPLQVEIDQPADFSQDVASGRRTRVLWTGFGFAAIILSGLSAYVFLPLAPHAVAEPSRLEAAFIPSMPAGIAHARSTGGRPAMLLTGANRGTALRPTLHKGPPFFGPASKTSLHARSSDKGEQEQPSAYQGFAKKLGYLAEELHRTVLEGKRRHDGATAHARNGGSVGWRGKPGSLGDLMLRRGATLATIAMLSSMGPAMALAQPEGIFPDVVPEPLTMSVPASPQQREAVAVAASPASPPVSQLVQSEAVAVAESAPVVQPWQPASEPFSTGTSADRGYININGFPFPVGPFFERKTVITELVKDRVYSFEQPLTLSDISANVRTTVFRMRNNKLLVYNPVAPTKEFLNELDSLKSDGVAHILLGATQYEHKEFVGPFTRRFPEAKVWAVPGQWSFPLNLPAKFYGIDTEGSGGGDLVDTTKGSIAYTNAPDFTDEFEVKLMQPAETLGFGFHANEAALFHKDTKVLAVTDALVKVPGKPTPIYDERALSDIGDNSPDGGTVGNFLLRLAEFQDYQGTAKQEIGDLFAANAQGTPAEQLQRGWERTSLFVLYFGPASSSIADPDPSFQKLADKWIVAPVTRKLIYDSPKVQPELIRWVDDVAKWDFNLISPSHFAAMPGTPKDMQEAFKQSLSKDDARAESPYGDGDSNLLNNIHDVSDSLGLL